MCDVGHAPQYRTAARKTCRSCLPVPAFAPRLGGGRGTGDAAAVINWNTTFSTSRIFSSAWRVSLLNATGIAGQRCRRWHGHLQQVHLHAVDAKFIVQMRAGGHSRAAHIANHRALRHTLARWIPANTAHMPVQRGLTGAMIQNDHAVRAYVAVCGIHRPCTGGLRSLYTTRQHRAAVEN